MANLKDIRLRISSVINTRQVTNAMKMVSAAKLRKSQDALFKMRPYASGIEDIFNTLFQELPQDISSPLFKQRPPKKTLIILITSNKGLCGTFNSAITRKALEWVKKEFPGGKKDHQFSFFIIGKKGFETITRNKLPIIGREDNLIQKPSYQFTSFFIKELSVRFVKGEFDRVIVFYNSFKTAASQIQCMETLLPIEVVRIKDQKRHIDYIFEPSPIELVESYSHKLLEIKMHRIILDSIASEHGARMTAMHKATDNASELINTLRLTYNKARQDNITREINEIVSGANALRG